MSSYKNYFDLQLEYEAFYNKEVIILEEVGLFYEFYEYEPQYDQTFLTYKYNNTIGHVSELSEKLQIVCNFRNVRIFHDINNPIVAGFPVISAQKYIKNILNFNYIVIKLDRSKADPSLTHCISEIIQPD
jgi:hypothetical protein